MFSMGHMFLCMHGMIQDLRYQDLRSWDLKSENLSSCLKFYALMVWYWYGTILNYEDLWSRDLRYWDLSSQNMKLLAMPCILKTSTVLCQDLWSRDLRSSDLMGRHTLKRKTEFSERKKL